MIYYLAIIHLSYSRFFHLFFKDKQKAKETTLNITGFNFDLILLGVLTIILSLFTDIDLILDYLFEKAPEWKAILILIVPLLISHILFLVFFRKKVISKSYQIQNRKSLNITFSIILSILFPFISITFLFTMLFVLSAFKDFFK